MPGKTELINQVMSESGLTRPQASKAVDAMLEAITRSLAAGDPVSLTGFGTFRVRETAERQGRNPSTREPMTIPAGKRVGFSAGTRLSAAVKETGGNGMGGGRASQAAKAAPKRTTGRRTGAR